MQPTASSSKSVPREVHVITDSDTESDDDVCILPDRKRRRVTSDSASQASAPSSAPATPHPTPVTASIKNPSQVRDHHYTGGEWKFAPEPAATSQWRWRDTVLHWESKGLVHSTRIAAFDFDDTLVRRPRHKKAYAWVYNFPSTKKQLQDLHHDGYKIVIFSNQGGVGRTVKDTARTSTLDNLQRRIEGFIEETGVPMQAFLATAVEKDNVYRKPGPGMWQLMVREFNGGLAPNMQESFYVGDAAGRVSLAGVRQKKDRDDSDRQFAAAVGLRFIDEMTYFLDEESLREIERIG